MTDLAVTDAEVTLLAGMAGVDSFPTAMPPDLDDGGWGTVARGLLARGLAYEEDGLVMSEKAAVLVGGVVFAKRSLWIRIQYRPGEGDNAVQVLWIGDEGIVRHSLDSDAGVHHLARCERSALEELLAATLDFPIAQGSEAGKPQTISHADFYDAIDLSLAEGAVAAAGRYPVAGDYLAALDTGRRATRVKLTGGADADDTFPWRAIEIVEARQALWLSHNVAPGPPTDDAPIIIQRITVDMAREQLIALAEAT